MVSKAHEFDKIDDVISETYLDLNTLNHNQKPSFPVRCGHFCRFYTINSVMNSSAISRITHNNKYIYHLPSCD